VISSLASNDADHFGRRVELGGRIPRGDSRVRHHQVSGLRNEFEYKGRKAALRTDPEIRAATAFDMID
jgi:hypothetical protein